MKYEIWRLNSRLPGRAEYLGSVEAEDEECAEAYGLRTFDFNGDAGDRIDVQVDEEDSEK